MSGTEDLIKGKWKEIKGEVRKKWGTLTENDLEATKGNLQALVGLVQQKAGLAKDDASKKLKEVVGQAAGIGATEFAKLWDKANTVIDQAKDKLKKPGA